MPLPGRCEVGGRACRCPQVDTDDPAAGVLASITATEPAELMDILAGAPQDSIEVRLRIVRARIELGERAPRRTPTCTAAQSWRSNGCAARTGGWTGTTA